MMRKNLKYLIVAVLSLGIFTSCSEDDLEPTLQQNKDVDTSINTVNDLQAVIDGAYNRLSSYTYFGRDIILLGEVFGDNAASINNSNRFVIESRMDLLGTTATASTFWQQAYAVIGSANIVIHSEEIEGSEQEINQLKGQAYALRAMAHFDLVKFYGQQHVNGGGLSALGVPYVTTFRDSEALFPTRNSVQEVRDMVYADLETAASLMDNRPANVYMSIYAAKALEARVANYFGDWARSLSAAEFVVNSGEFSIVDAANFVASFDQDGGENSIFEIAASETDNQGINGIANLYMDTSYGDVVALPNLAAVYEVGDVRGESVIKTDSIDDKVEVEVLTLGIISEDTEGNLRNTGKYPSVAPYDDNIQVFRYEEVVLIYAEALFETGNTSEALTYLNMVPNNRATTVYEMDDDGELVLDEDDDPIVAVAAEEVDLTYDSVTKENILLERRKELAFEGFRFHDLARNQMDIPFVDETIQTHKGPSYGEKNYALPIPASEVDANSNVPQNTGY